MKLRVIRKKNGKYYSQYYLEGPHSNRWAGTYRTLDSITQNEFDTKKQAIAECYWFAEHKSEGTVMWEGETNDIL